jgi:phospholipid/cholesterol/gamma-HCH transport system substrate-binding protein
VLALGVVVLIVAYLVFAGGGGGEYELEFNEASQLVKGDQVQVGGVPVGSVTNIVLLHDFRAQVTIHVESSLTPLHQGTTAQVRVPSLSSVANRYILLSPGPNNRPALPNGATLPASVDSAAVDLDQLFNALNPKTRAGLQQFIQGTAEQYAGAGRQLGESIEYFPPFLSATSHLLGQLVKEQPVFTNFLVESAKAVTTIGARQEQLTDLIEHADQTFQAIGSHQTQLAEGLHQLPKALRAGDAAFAQAPSTFAALEALVKTSKPTTAPLTTLLAKLRPLLQSATPAVHNFSLAFSRPGPSNDLTDLARGLPALARTLSTSTPSSVTALKESAPITAFFGPYAPDLTGTLRTFGQAGAFYEANGHYARVSPILPDFKLGEEDTLTPTSPTQALENLKSGQLRRCPGAATEPAPDGSSPFTDGEQLSCDPLETP